MNQVSRAEHVVESILGFQDSGGLYIAIPLYLVQGIGLSPSPPFKIKIIHLLSRRLPLPLYKSIGYSFNTSKSLGSSVNPSTPVKEFKR
jgi:hypothetical protein